MVDGPEMGRLHLHRPHALRLPLLHVLAHDEHLGLDRFYRSCLPRRRLLRHVHVRQLADQLRLRLGQLVLQLLRLDPRLSVHHLVDDHSLIDDQEDWRW